MPTCDICCEEFLSEADLKTHLLLSHLENEMACPFCSLSGVSYDELNFHINTTHIENDCQVMHATASDSSQRTSNDRTLQSPTHKINSVRTTETCMSAVSQASTHSPGHCQVNGMPAPNTGATLSKVTSSKVNSSPPAAATASAFKPVRTTQPLSNCHEKSKEGEHEHRKSKQMRLSSPNKGDPDFSTSEGKVTFFVKTLNMVLFIYCSGSLSMSDVQSCLYWLLYSAAACRVASTGPGHGRRFLILKYKSEMAQHFLK